MKELQSHFDPQTLVKMKPIYSHQTKGFRSRHAETAIAKTMARLRNLEEAHKDNEREINEHYLHSLYAPENLIAKRRFIKRWHYVTRRRLEKKYNIIHEVQL